MSQSNQLTIDSISQAKNTPRGVRQEFVAHTNNSPAMTFTLCPDKGRTLNMTDVGRTYDMNISEYKQKWYAYWPKEVAPVSNLPAQAFQQPAPKQQDNHGPDPEVEGKVLHGVVCAAIQSGQIRCDSLQAARQIADFVLGKTGIPF